MSILTLDETAPAKGKPSIFRTPAKKRKPRVIVVADLFCGAGGTSTGALRALKKAGYQVKLTAVNHWKRAVETHTLNHPEARHLCASLDALNPRDYFKTGELDLLLASPECTHHSVARGGKPIRDQSRATAWCVIRWAEALLPKEIIVENVKEFANWAPLIKGWVRVKENGVMIRKRDWVPDPKRKGEIFQAWLATLRSIGYTVEIKVLCAADYGEHTTRKRLFIRATLGAKAIQWPAPSHQPIPKDGKPAPVWLPGVRHWKPAKDIIDWSIQGESIFDRPEPLCENTMRRIFKGLEKFSGLSFTLGQQSGASPRSIHEPIATVCTAGKISLIQPVLVNMKGMSNGADIRLPAPAITAGARHLAIAVPELKPFVMATDHTGGSGSFRGMHQPLQTVVTKQCLALIKPFLIKYYKTGIAKSLDAPLDTVTTKDRYALIKPILLIQGDLYILDILFRFLNAQELAAAQGFPAGYQFVGSTEDIIMQIGNAVPPAFAEALTASAFHLN